MYATEHVCQKWWIRNAFFQGKVNQWDESMRKTVMLNHVRIVWDIRGWVIYQDQAKTVKVSMLLLQTGFNSDIPPGLASTACQYRFQDLMFGSSATSSCSRTASSPEAINQCCCRLLPCKEKLEKRYDLPGWSITSIHDLEKY